MSTSQTKIHYLIFFLSTSIIFSSCSSSHTIKSLSSAPAMSENSRGLSSKDDIALKKEEMKEWKDYFKRIQKAFAKVSPEEYSAKIMELYEGVDPKDNKFFYHSITSLVMNTPVNEKKAKDIKINSVVKFFLN